jgi:hypothetical protein
MKLIVDFLIKFETLNPCKFIWLCFDRFDHLSPIGRRVNAEGDRLGIIWGVVILGVAVENPFPSLKERTTSGFCGVNPPALQRRSGVTATAVCEPKPVVFP